PHRHPRFSRTSAFAVRPTLLLVVYFFFFSSRRRHTRSLRDWSSDVCSSDLINLPLSSVHRNAASAAEVALCAARQQRFWPMHDLLFRHQDQWAALASPREYLLALGDSAGLDRTRLAGCVASGATAAEVRADAERARGPGATTTPPFHIERALLAGAA